MFDWWKRTRRNRRLRIEYDKQTVFEYSEHDAVITFKDGRTREVTFDHMNYDDGIVYFSNYDETHWIKGWRSPGLKKFLSIDRNVIESVETTEREQMTLTETFTYKAVIAEDMLQEYQEERENVRVVEVLEG